METKKLRDELIYQIWRIDKLDLLSKLREFIEGETAALWYIAAREGINLSPSQISDGICVSRARAANILRSLRSKGYVGMEISPEDRRKIDVVLTPFGKEVLEGKRKRFMESFDRYVEAIGEENVKELNRILKLTADNEERLQCKKPKKEEPAND